MENIDFYKGVPFLSKIFVFIRFQIDTSQQIEWGSFCCKLHKLFSDPKDFTITRLKEELLPYVSQAEQSYFLRQFDELEPPLNNNLEVLKYKEVLIELLNQLVILGRQGDEKKISRFVDIFHNFPNALSNEELWKPEVFWKHEVKTYRKEFNKKFFLREAQKQLFPSLIVKILKSK